MRSSFRLTALPAALTLAAMPCMVVGCASDEGSSALGSEERIGEIQAELTKAERTTRYTKIKTTSASRDIPNNAYMLAGIAYAETGLAHCWSEATWACKGPNSADCSNGPVIAGSGDGPCANEQGGLGMFQFDAGTYAQTLAKYGNEVLTISGNVSHAITYVINMVKNSAYTTNAETDAKALAWINNFDPGNATLRDQWVKTVTHYYNGCKPTYSCWNQRYKHYNDSLQYVIDDTGLPFWVTAAKPAWKASYVSQSFPLASKPFVLTPGQTQTGYIELRNDGASTWNPGEVFLATSQPRDGASPFAGPDWTTPSRAATVTAATAPGQSAKFTFTVKAPAQLGDYPQYFNLVRSGVAWFSDDGQGGPPDNQLQIKLTVEAGTCPDGLGDAWVCEGQQRVRCEPSTGAVFEETCAELCADTDAGAACVNEEPGGEAGSAGQAGSSGSEGGTSGEAGTAGNAGNAGNGGSNAGEGGSAGTDSAGEAGKAGSKSGNPSESVIVQQADGEEQSGCSASTGTPSSPAAWLLGLAALATGSKLRRRKHLRARRYLDRVAGSESPAALLRIVHPRDTTRCELSTKRSHRALAHTFAAKLASHAVYAVRRARRRFHRCRPRVAGNIVARIERCRAHQPLLVCRAERCFQTFGAYSCNTERAANIDALYVGALPIRLMGHPTYDWTTGSTL